MELLLARTDVFAFTCNGQSKKTRTGAFATLKENQRFSEPWVRPKSYGRQQKTKQERVVVARKAVLCAWSRSGLPIALHLPRP